MISVFTYLITVVLIQCALVALVGMTFLGCRGTGFEPGPVVTQAADLLLSTVPAVIIASWIHGVSDILSIAFIVAMFAVLAALLGAGRLFAFLVGIN